MTIRKKRISEECHYAFDFSFFCLNAIGDIPRYFFVNLHRKEELGKSKTEVNPKVWTKNFGVHFIIY